MVTLTGYGGVGEIGGNAFLLDDGKSRVFLDFGRRFGNDRGVEDGGMQPGWGDYFDEYLQPRSFRMIQDLTALQLIPDPLSAYRPDLGGTAGPAGIDAVIISHAHADHAGLIPYLKPDIPVLASAETQATLASLQTTGTGVANEYIDVRAKGFGRTKTGKVTASPRHATGPTRAFLTDEHHEAGGWDVSQFAVDHSIHGARGTILAGRDVTVAYTGDFRMHGRDADATARFIEKAGGADVLITEGTRVSRDSHGHNETDEEVAVEGEVEAAIDRRGDGFVGIAWPPRDLDRFISIWNVARRNGRRLVISTKQAQLLESLRASGRTDLPDPRRDHSLAIHIRARKRGMVNASGTVPVFDANLGFEDVALDPEDAASMLLGDYEAWERPYLETNNCVTSADVAAATSGYLLGINYWTITELFDVFPQDRDSRPGGLYIHSMTQPFNDDMEISDRKLARWLNAFQLERTNTHVSGHVDEENLHWVIDEIGAKTLVPIHSQAPDLTKERYEARTGHKALLPQWGQEMAL